MPKKHFGIQSQWCLHGNAQTDTKMKLRLGKLNTNFEEIKKIIIAPQIVVYKKIFKHSQEIIELMQKDRSRSFFSNWSEWYGQGFRKDFDFNLLETLDVNEDETLLIEKDFIAEVNDCMKFIRADYLNEFKKEKGIWPSFIEDWEVLSDTNKKYWIDFFRYDVSKINARKDANLLMDYHVDEFPIPGETKENRHVATVNFYLNDTYDGGEICVYDSISNNTYMYKPSAGDAVIMPSTEPFYHGVKPFSKTDRYFLRAFIDYKVNKDYEWVNKYSVQKDDSLLSGVSTEKDYVDKDLQIIKLSIPSNIIEVKG
jgi:hypothetical protein